MRKNKEVVLISEERAIDIHTDIWTRVVEMIQEGETDAIAILKGIAVTNMFYDDKAISYSEYKLLKRETNCALCTQGCQFCHKMGLAKEDESSCLGGLYDQATWGNPTDKLEASIKIRDLFKGEEE